MFVANLARITEIKSTANFYMRLFHKVKEGLTRKLAPLYFSNVMQEKSTLWVQKDNLWGNLHTNI